MKLRDEALAVAALLDRLKASSQELGVPFDEDAAKEILPVIAEAGTHATMFHMYAHSPDAPDPDWAQAGLWSRRVTEILSGRQ